MKAFFGGGAGATAAVVGAAVVVGGGAVAIQRGGGDPAPSPAATTRVAATVADVRDCTILGPGGAPVTPSTGPARVTLPAQVELPPGATVHRTGQGLLIGPAGASCEGSIGVNAGANRAGDVRTARVTQSWQGSIGGIASQLCHYFPDSPQARRERERTGDCTSRITGREDLPTGTPAYLAVLAPNDPEPPERPSSPFVAATLATLDSQGVASPITCTAPADNAGICTAALTYWYLQSLEGEEIAEADLDRAAEHIARFVSATRR
ncbi:hypothetical protein E1200_27590 [Actinomadura sp. GC306]|nr:hypothetical protein E1200_27590 [Actinomadura sp. GC306]